MHKRKGVLKLHKVHFKKILAMDKKAKIALAVTKKVYNEFLETRNFIDKAYREECCKENMTVDKVLFSINNNC